MRTEVYTTVQVAWYLCTIQLYRVVRFSDHESLSNEETRDLKEELDEIDKKFDEHRGVK